MPVSVRARAPLIAFAFVACGGEPLPVIYPDAGVVDGGPPPPPPDAGVLDLGGRPDFGPPVGPNEGVLVSGSILSLDTYLAGAGAPVGAATLTPLGVNGVAAATANAQGGYSMTVPQNGKMIFSISKTGYLASYESIDVSDLNIPGKNFYLASDAYAAQIGAAYGVDAAAPFACHAPNNPAAQCRYAMIMGRVVDDGTGGAGTPAPVAGITKDNFRVTGDGDAAWYKKGPYFLAPNGAPSAALLSTQRERDPADATRYRGGLYVVYVEVPVVGLISRTFELSITYNDQGIERAFGPLLVQGYGQGLTWAVIRETGQVVVPNPPPINGIDFDTQVFSLFAPLNVGGFGCLGCHTNANGAIPAGGMNLYGGPEIAYQALNPQTYPARVNLQSPAASYLLVRPLYEADGNQDHPIFAFTSNQDPAYRIIYTWIQEGGIRRPVGMPPPQGLVSFYGQVRPILYRPRTNGGAGCIECHGDPAHVSGFYVGGNGNSLYAELTTEAPTDDGGTGEPYRINKQGQAAKSLVLLNPLAGSPEPHPAKLFTGADDPRYQLIYQWITQGYLNNSPL